MQIAKSPRNLCGQVVDNLGCQILSGGIVPGSSLPQEGALCEEMGVSRTVIREAIKTLAAKGLVDSRPKRGTVVQSHRSWNYLDPEVLDWQTRADTSGGFLIQLTELRQAIEPVAAGMAARRATDDDLQLIVKAFQEMERTADDVERFLASDIGFHAEVLHAANNPFFGPVANVISACLKFSLRVTNRQPQENHDSLPVHRKVMEAIRDRQPHAAQTAMRFLLDDATARIERSIGTACEVQDPITVGGVRQ